ncbi:MAG: glycosyltransferase [Bacillota bacterium]|nr:glycosyltransferase [Bacillota bacterium]
MMLPKVLIVNGTKIGVQNGTGISLQTIFSGWPKDKILQIVPLAYKQSDNESSMDYPCIMLPQKCFPFEYIFRKLFMLIYGKKIWSEALGDTDDNASAEKFSFKTLLKSYMDTSPVIIKKNVYKAIEEYNPDVIYTMLGSIKIAKMVYKIAKKTNKKVVFHFMDDWVEDIYAQSALTKIPRTIFYRLFKKLLKRTNCNLAISKAMAEEYEKRYNKKFDYIMNSVTHFGECKELNNNSVKLIYMGGLHLERWKLLKDLAEILKKYDNIKLEIYAPLNDAKQYSKLIENKNVKFMQPVEHKMVNSVLSSSDIAVFCESFDNNIAKYTRFSLSTKIPEYFSSGLPILCYAPKYLASSQYIAESECGICAENLQELQDALDKLIRDRDIYRKLSENCINTAKSNHLQETTQNKLISVFS